MLALPARAGYAVPDLPFVGAPQPAAPDVGGPARQRVGVGRARPGRPAGSHAASSGFDALLGEPGLVLPRRREEIVRAPAGRASGQVPSRPSDGSAARTASPFSADVSVPKQANLDVLARQVYAIIKQRLAVERERVGGARGLRLW